MMIHGTIKRNTPLVINREDMIKLDNSLFSNHCERILYIGTTVYGEDIAFSSLDELLQLEKLKDHRFRALRIIGFCGKTRVLHITLGWLNKVKSGLKYPDVLVCKYSCSSVKDEKALKMSMEDFIMAATAGRPALAGYMNSIILCFLFIISVVGTYFLFSKWDLGSVSLGGFFGLLLLLYVSLFFLVNIVMWAVSRFTEYLFPPIAFAWGIGEEDYKQRKELRGKIFWSVLVGGIISFIAGLILNLSHG